MPPHKVQFNNYTMGIATAFLVCTMRVGDGQCYDIFGCLKTIPFLHKNSGLCYNYVASTLTTYIYGNNTHIRLYKFVMHLAWLPLPSKKKKTEIQKTYNERQKRNTLFRFSISITMRTPQLQLKCTRRTCYACYLYQTELTELS